MGRMKIMEYEEYKHRYSKSRCEQEKLLKLVCDARLCDEDAKAVMEEFYCTLKEHRTDDVYIKENDFMSYAHYLILMQAELDKERYTGACNELGSLTHRYPIFQSRIKNNILRILGMYLDVEGKHSMSFVGSFIKKHKFKYKGILVDYYISRQFDEIMDEADLIEKNYADEEKDILLKYMMDILKTDLQAEHIATLFYTEHTPEINSIFPMIYHDEKGCSHRLSIEKQAKTVCLNKDTVVVAPWNRTRWENSVLNIYKNGFNYHSNNHHAYYFTDIDVCYVWNGNHSITAGICTNAGEILADRIDISPMFEHVQAKCDGWYNIHTGKRFSNVIDYRMCAIYEIARRRYAIKK